MTKIAVLGSHPHTVWLAPFDDPEWKIWACSPHNFEKRTLPRVDEWFEVHQPAFCPRTRRRPYLDYVRDLSEKIPVWMRDRRDHPKALEYPEEEMVREFGPFHSTSSIVFIVAKAIMEQPEAIGFWGIMQQSKEEYVMQRQGLQHYFWEAHKRGIDIMVPEVSKLFAPPASNW